MEVRRERDLMETPLPPEKHMTAKDLNVREMECEAGREGEQGKKEGKKQVKES